MTDLGEKLDDIEGLADKRLSILGLRFTPTQLGLAFGLVSTIVGGLYGGFVMYQRVEEIASLDLGAYQQQMNETSTKIETQSALLTSIEQNLRDTKQLTYDIEKRVNDKVVYFEGKMDKFEAKVDQTKTELEDRIQKALDNPLADMK
jgi:hypothetical protein